VVNDATGLLEVLDSAGFRLDLACRFMWGCAVMLSSCWIGPLLYTNITLTHLVLLLFMVFAIHSFTAGCNSATKTMICFIEFPE
jgi:hypothetical protein